MANAKQDTPILVQEKGELSEAYPTPRQLEHERHVDVKKGDQRLDKRSAQGSSALPRKSGQGKFGWGAAKDAVTPDDAPVALDKNDPNYVDEEEEEADRRVATNVVETPLSDSGAQPDNKV